MNRWFSDLYFKVLLEDIKLFFFKYFLYGQPEQKVLKVQEFSGMGCLKIFWVKGRNPKQGVGVQRPPPPLCILTMSGSELFSETSSDLKTWIRHIQIRNPYILIAECSSYFYHFSFSLDCWWLWLKKDKNVFIYSSSNAISFKKNGQWTQYKYFSLSVKKRKRWFKV